MLVFNETSQPVVDVPFATKPLADPVAASLIHSSIVKGAKNNTAASYTFDENTRLMTVYLLDITDEEK